MAFTPIASADIAEGKPIKQGLLQQVKDNFDALNTNLMTAIENMVPNGSFEIDSDSDGVPDNWTRNLYGGGVGQYSAGYTAHGAKAYQIYATVGANGGGYLTSDYIPCSEYSPLTFRCLYMSSYVVRGIITINFYTAAKVIISGINVYDTQAQVFPFVEVLRGVVPPAGSRFCKIQLFGAYPNGQIGSSYFDAVSLEAKRQEQVNAYGTGTMTAGQSVSALSINAVQVATPPDTVPYATHSIVGVKVNVAGSGIAGIVLTGPSAGTLGITLPAGLWTIVAAAHWRNGDGGTTAGTWRISAYAIREA